MKKAYLILFVLCFFALRTVNTYNATKRPKYIPSNKKRNPAIDLITAAQNNNRNRARQRQGAAQRFHNHLRRRIAHNPLGIHI